MRIAPKAVDQAFEAFHRRYVDKATRAWDLDHHGRLWAQARASVESKSDDSGFVETLGELRSHWQIARGRGSKMLESEKVLPLLRQKAAKAMTGRLSQIKEKDARWLYQLVGDVAAIKQVNGEVSLMAVSKVLHFFNPRLFVIVDRAMVWDWTLAHNWIWEPMRQVRERVDRATGFDPATRDDMACDAGSYAAILIACGQLLRDNPHIGKRFAGFLHRKTTSEASLPSDLETYERPLSGNAEESFFGQQPEDNCVSSGRSGPNG
jgi:hypothetical protein